MYKTKLQELCHKKRWSLPEYSYAKEGPDHIPCFKASVVVNGVTFQTSNDFTSSKLAQNDAARLALHKFTDLNEINQYKLMLQTYAERNKLDMPWYSEDMKGPPHAPCFKATVFVEGHPYQSPRSYKTLKEAEQAAAQVALLSLLSFTTDTFQENGSTLYKKSLQELAQNEGFFLPTYKTDISGEPHNPSFISTVTVGGETFQGTAAKSKKKAESNAARAAYTAFMERKQSRTANSSSSSSAYEALEVKPGSVIPPPPDLSSLSIGGS